MITRRSLFSGLLGLFIKPAPKKEVVKNYGKIVGHWSGKKGRWEFYSEATIANRIKLDEATKKIFGDNYEFETDVIVHEKGIDLRIKKGSNEEAKTP
jgi:hypothetical protein